MVDLLQSQANARVNISESIPGNPERILSVQGALDAVAKVSQRTFVLAYFTSLIRNAVLLAGLRTHRQEDQRRAL